MPISAENMKLYPGGSIHSKEWKAIRFEILERAEHRCEFCSVPDRKLIFRTNSGFILEDGETYDFAGNFITVARGSEFPDGKFVKIILTIMHLDHDPTNNDPENLKAGCQRCHNKWDAPHRAKNAAKTRRKKSAQTDLEDYLEALG